VKLLAGTSGYSFKEWKGSFYPAELKSDQLLGFYATKFPTLEINNTFYRLPKEHVLLEWASQVPEEFTFALKASQRITHHTRLKADSEPLVAFLLKNTSVLGGKLGPILFQLPPNLKKDLDRLQNFLTYLPQERRYAFEFRHESWFEEDVFRIMRDRDIAMCIAEQADFKCPVVCTASWGYLRLHRLDYDRTALEEWASCVTNQAWSEAYVYFKHDEGVGSGPPAVQAFVDAGTTGTDNR
jgi:uncharacterized protein YecE (DUF72 family)